MYQLLILLIIFIIGYQYYIKQVNGEKFTCYPDIYDDKYHNIRANYINQNDVNKLLARNPKYINKTIIQMNKDTANTIYYSAYSKEGELVGYLKMAVSEKFMANLIDVGFYEQELFGFSGWFGFHIYELVGFDEMIVEKLVKHAIHQLKEDGNRYYLSILCLDEKLAQVLINRSQYFTGMIPHHSMAILTSKKILENDKTLNDREKEFIRNIIKTQENEIKNMKTFIKKDK